MLSLLRRAFGREQAQAPAFRPLLSEEEVAEMDAAYWRRQPEPYVCTYVQSSPSGAITFRCHRNVMGKGLFCPGHKWAEAEANLERLANEPFEWDEPFA